MSDYGEDFDEDFHDTYHDEDDDIETLQRLIDSGTAWRLEGAVGRAAMSAIEAGLCTLGPVGHRDFYGNYVPAIHEVQPGTKGSLEYAEARR